VELTGQLSNPSGELDRMLGGETADVTTMKPAVRRRAGQQKHVKLSEATQVEIVLRFRAGALQRELAEIYGVNRTTIAAIVRRHASSPKE